MILTVGLCLLREKRGSTEADQFGVQIKRKQREFTGSGLLSVVSSVYDPLGLVCPFVLGAKIIFQDGCKSGKDWDDPLSPENRVQWSKWLDKLPLMGQFKVECCLMPADMSCITSVTLLCQLMVLSPISVR